MFFFSFFVQFSGGMSNYLYLIALPPGTKPVKGEPMDVLLRIYGQISKSTLDFLVHNSVVFALLAERNLGPKPFGMYHDGRVEEFIKVRGPTRISLMILYIICYLNLLSKLLLSNKPCLQKVL